MDSGANENSPIPSAPFDDLDLDTEEGHEEWERRVMAMAADRIVAERARLEGMGIIDKDGNLVSTADHVLETSSLRSPRSLGGARLSQN